VIHVISDNDCRSLNAGLSPADRRHFESRFRAWRSSGTSSRAATVLALAGCDTAEEVARLGRSHFEGLPNCADRTLAELADLAGWPPPRRTAADAIAAALAMGLGPVEAREAAADALSALRRAGFVIVAAQQQEARP
jgi:hypothetical protein